MRKFLCGILIIFSLCETNLCFAQYRSRPINISKRRYHQIKARQYHRREVAIVPRRFRDSFWDRFRPRTNKVHYINNNSINRKRNQKMITRKRKTDRDYGNYRDMQAKQSSEKSNFSIYDK